MSLYQCLIIFGIVFAGEYLIPEESGYEPNLNGMVYPGRAFTFGGDPLWQPLQKTVGTSRHYTVVFTVFVLLQITNMVCARKINDEKNIFQGFFSNGMFVSIIFLIAIVQYLLSQFTGDIFKVSRDGLSSTQWLICVVLAFSVWPVNLFIKFLPDSVGFELGKKKAAVDPNNLVHRFRSQRTGTLTKQATQRLERQMSRA